MLEELFALPDEEERDYLLGGLARLVALRGAETLLTAPLLLPEPKFWPDALETRGHGVATLLRRLLSYAGLAELGIDIEIGPAGRRDVIEDLEKDPGSLNHAAGWFLGIEDEVCHFGVSDSSLRDEELLIGTLGHEVAHAYRERHRLVVSSRETEERLTDLTTVYLGFGFFTLESSFRFKTGHYDDGGQRLLYERQTLGYLRPGQLALLLGAQLVVRKHGASELATMVERLSPNQAKAVALAYGELEPDREALIAELGLPPPESWPEPKQLAEVQASLAPATLRVADHVAEEREWAEENAIAFRVRDDRSASGAALGALAGFALSLMSGMGRFVLPIVLAFAGAGYWLGRRLASARCSSCERRVRVAADACGFCNTRLVGTIATLAERFDAEERYWADSQRQ